MMARGGVAVVLFAAVAAASAGEDPWARAVRLVAQMTQDEKFELIQQNLGARNTSCTRLKHKYVGCLVGVPRLGIPDVRLNDGPEGFRGPAGLSTQWPSGLTLAHSWDPILMREYGVALGTEFAAKGANVMYGPGLNVARLANGGRSFEYGSGEDPFLGAALVGEEVQGIQAQGVVANAKHFIDNNQEGYFGAGDRHNSTAVIDERTQMEIYYPPFEAAIDAGVLSFMCANNMVNGVYACEYNATMNGLLRGRSGFKGWVCSDYDGTRSTIDAANHGLDIAMPGPPNRPDYFGAPLRAALANGDVLQSTIDDKVTRVVYSLAAVGALDTPKAGTPDTDVTSQAHRALARKFAAQSATLLQNNKGLLPLDHEALVASGAGSILLVGDAAGKGAIYGGSGSGKVTPKAPVSVLDALSARLNGSTSVLKYLDGSDKAAVTKAAKKAQVVVVVIAQTSSEGRDRTTLVLDGDDMVSTAASAQPNTVVIAISPGPFLTKWRDTVAAVLDFGMAGEQEGAAVVDVLFGDVNPGGKLPHTLPNEWNETKMSLAQYPGSPPVLKKGEVVCSKIPTASTANGRNPSGGTGAAPCVPTAAHYEEKLLVGYRWYDAHDVVPAYPFGHGLSYTVFAYAGLRVQRGAVRFNVTNTGSVAGAEVAQVYLVYPAAAGEPPQVLRGFKKVWLPASGTSVVEIPLSDRSYSVWDTEAHNWSLVQGEFEVRVGASSRDIRLKGSITIN
eukprot:Hpha_TRINITY_DN26229_c0_g1::TRINITY_DN26229_c0_g1_i1::g.184661::m.184661/K05349/bglX; beta-glucosidase